MNNRTTICTVYTLLFILAGILSGTTLRAQITYDNFLPKSSIVPGALLTVSDPDTNVTGGSVFINRTQYVSLVYTAEAHTDVQNYTPWSYGVVVKIMNGADTTQYFTDTLDIRRNDSLPLYQALNHYTLPWYALRIRVVSVCGKTGVDSTCLTDPHLYPLLPADMELQAAVIRTQINGFSAMSDIPSAPVEYDEGEVLAACEARYNSRLNTLKQEYDALATQRLQDYMGTLGTNTAHMDDIENRIRIRTLAGLSRLTDTLVHADTVYQHQCDSIPMDNETLALLQSVSHEAFMDHFYGPYFAWFNTLSKNLYTGSQTYALIRSTDSTGYIDHVFDGFDHWGSRRLQEVWSLYPPSVGSCVMEHFGDTAAHWSERALAIIRDMYLVRDSVLDDKNTDDSLYMLFQGAKLQIAMETDNDYRAAVNVLNEEMLILCGYDGKYMGDCNGYFNGLINANKAYMAALMDSVADTVAVTYGIAKGTLGQVNPSVTAAVNSLLTDYNKALYALDGQWAACGSDSAQTDSILKLLTGKSVNSNYLASQFLLSRQGNIINRYSSTGTLPTLAEWQTLTTNLINTYRGEGKVLVLDKQAAIHTGWPGLDSCTGATYTGMKDATENAVAALLAKIDSTLDTLNVYGTADSYTYEIALAKWMTDYPGAPAYLTAQAKNDSLVTEKNETCGSGSVPPPESYFACLARTEADLRNLQYGRNMILAEADSLTGNFRGIVRPGGWNDANGYLADLLDPLVGQYRYRCDSLVSSLFGPCFTDSVQHQRFLDLTGTYDPLWEQSYAMETLYPALEALFPDDEFDLAPYVSSRFDSLSHGLTGAYTGYFAQRSGPRFRDPVTAWSPDSTVWACLDSVRITRWQPTFDTLMLQFAADMNAFIEAGAAGITPDDSAYRESVLFYTLYRTALNKMFRKFFDAMNRARQACSSVLKNTDTPETGIPEPATPSVEAEVAACQTDVENRLELAQTEAQTRTAAVPALAFAAEAAGGMNLTPLQIALTDSVGLRMHRSLDPADSLWLACNTDPAALNILATLFDSDVMISVLFEHPPLYATDPAQLYAGGNTAQPDYGHVHELPGMDSLFYMALAERRAEWIVEKIQEQPGEYGIADSCIIHHQTDSAAEAGYAATYTVFENRLQTFLDSFRSVYDSTLIHPDTLERKLRWVIAAQLRETYLFLQQYVGLVQEYEACEALRTRLIVWKREPDPSWNPIQKGKGIPARFPVKPVGKFPLLPIRPDIMDLTTSTVTVITETGPCGNVRYLQWTPVGQAQEYDLEWAYIDDMVYLEGQKANQHADINYLAFSLTEPTRVTVKQNKFPFPGEYPDGKLYFRVRGVARVIDAAHQSYDQPQFFPWIYNWTGYAVSNAAVNFNGSNPFNNTFENNLNWQWEAGFAEEGKFKRVISYHDGLNRPQQVVTHLSTDNLSVIGETLYDHEGRAAVQVLPYPEPCRELSYRDKTRADSLGGSFDKQDFELGAGNGRMAATYGASQYYSVQNPFMAAENPLMHMGAVPDAQKYPYTQTAFMLDNTGRPVRSGGVGADHTSGGEHATRYFYANASETELRRLFGKNTGQASHYKKNAVMDANGQLSIAYVDQEGRSVATALAGLSPDNVMPLESNVPVSFTQNLTENNIRNTAEGEWTIHYAQLNETPDNEYTFTYTYGLDRLFDGTVPPCQVCEFDLDIYVTGPDGNRLTLTQITDAGTAVADTDLFHKRLDATSYGLTHPCSSTTLPKQLTFTVLMPEVNTYTIHKKLRRDKEADLAGLWAAARPGVNSYTASVQTGILNTYISRINYDECDQMFPGTGFGAIPPDIFDHTDDLATTSQCESYLTQMMNQITPYLGAGTSPMPLAGYYTGGAQANIFWNRVRDLIQTGISYPNDPDAIAPTAVAYYWGANPADANQTKENIKADPANWTLELRRELAKAHPEYCWYKKCLVYAQSVPYDAAMAQKTNTADGKAYRNPQNQSSGATNGLTDLFGSGGPTPINDPLNNGVIQNIISTSSGPDNNKSVWKVADDIQENYAANANLTADQAAWQAYRGGYLQAKSDAFYTASGNCPFLENTSVAVVVKPELPDTEEEMDNANTSAQQQWNNAQPCDDICRQNAIAWTAQMFANCGETGTDTQLGIYQSNKNVIIGRLEQYCMSKCGTANPMGIITEQMLAAAMNSTEGSPEYNLRYAIEVFNQTFAGVEGCDPITGTTQIHGTDTLTVWDAPFTYGEGEYVQRCDSFGVLVRIEDVQTWVNRINDAYDNMNDPDDSFIIPHFYGNLNSLVSTSCYLNNVSALGHIPLDIIPCDEAGPRDCYIGFLTDTPGTFTNMIKIRHVTLPSGALANAVYGFHGVDVPARFETWAVNENPITGDLSYGSFYQNVDGFLRINFATCCNRVSCSIFPNGWTLDITPDSLIEDCQQQLLEQAHQSAENSFNNWLEHYVDSLWQKADCEISEELRCTYTKSEYHYTLYYYDQAANLVQTVPPKGVHPLDINNTAYFSADGHWTGTTAANPAHDMESRYKFNSLEVAIESETPDGGLTLYTPDDKGRPWQSRNAGQRKRAAALGGTADVYSLTVYDGLGRIMMVMETQPGGPPTSLFTQTTTTLYDTPAEFGQIGWKSENTRSRVSSVQYYEDMNVLRHAVFYSYDIHGNVKSMLTQVPALKDFGQEFHRTDYYYDLVSGKVNEVHYQPKGNDRLYYRYRYDADNRLVSAETSRDYVNWERDAKYFYYPHGPLKRVETGHRKVQGTDYFYTVHGWLKGVNAGALNETYDLGRDGDKTLPGNPDAQVARDAFGFTLDYYNGDYKAVGGTGMNQIPYISGTNYGTAILEQGLYNGNIVRMATALRKPDETRLPVLGYGYVYDQLNRIRQNYAYLSSDLHTTGSWSGIMGSNAYMGQYTYDANGNITALKRYDGSAALRDDFTAYNYTAKNAYGGTGQFYNYKGPQNRLEYITDAVSSGTYSDDMDSQSAGNYAYDEIGNLVKDEAEEIDNIEWTVYGKVKSVLRESGSKKPDLYFYYNGAGQRYMKVVIPKNQSTGALLGKHDWKATYYQHDAQGNILAVYDIKGGPDNCGYDMFLAEHVLYGSSRLGTNTYDKYKMGYSGKSLAYPAISPVIYVCYEEADQNPAPFLPVDGGTGPIGGNWEIIKPYGPHRVPDTRVPITGVNLPWAGDDVNVKPTKEGTFFVPGRKRYEFSNHLGNVLVTVSDMPLGVDADSNGTVDYYMPDVKTTSDYGVWGEPLADRTINESSSYRFAFNGQMKDNEVYGEGNSYTAEFWQYDPRIGRRWNIDPIVKVGESPYSAFANSPIWIIDPTGADSTTYLYSSVGKNGKAVFSVEQLQKIADISKKVDEKNGINFTKYEVFATKDDFNAAVQNGSVSIDEKTDLAYEITDGYAGGFGFLVLGNTDTHTSEYGGKQIHGGYLNMGSINQALKQSNISSSYLLANAGVILAHERLAHGYGIIIEQMLGVMKGTFGGNNYHTPSGLSAAGITPLASNSYTVLRSTEVLSQPYKQMIFTLFSVSASGVLEENVEVKKPGNYASQIFGKSQAEALRTLFKTK